MYYSFSICFYIFPGVFNESTVRSLTFYGKDHPEFLDTAKYVEFILNLWKVMSLKPPSKGKVNKNSNFVYICYFIKRNSVWFYKKGRIG